MSSPTTLNWSTTINKVPPYSVRNLESFDFEKDRENFAIGKPLVPHKLNSALRKAKSVDDTPKLGTYNLNYRAGDQALTINWRLLGFGEDWNNQDIMAFYPDKVVSIFHGTIKINPHMYDDGSDIRIAKEIEKGVINETHCAYLKEWALYIQKLEAESVPEKVDVPTDQDTVLEDTFAITKDNQVIYSLRNKKTKTCTLYMGTERIGDTPEFTRKRDSSILPEGVLILSLQLPNGSTSIQEIKINETPRYHVGGTESRVHIARKAALRLLEHNTKLTSQNSGLQEQITNQSIQAESTREQLQQKIDELEQQSAKQNAEQTKKDAEQKQKIQDLQDTIDNFQETFEQRNNTIKENNRTIQQLHDTIRKLRTQANTIKPGMMGVSKKEFETLLETINAIQYN